MTEIDFFQRRAGVLLHPSSLPSGYVDVDAYRWIDLLADAGFSCWQMLPLNPPDDGLSPYHSISAFAMNINLLKEYPVINVEDKGFVTFCKANKLWLDDYADYVFLKKINNNAKWTDWPDELKNREIDALNKLHQQEKVNLDEIKWQQYVLSRFWKEIKSYANSRDVILFGDMPIFVSHDSADVWANKALFMLDEEGYSSKVTGVPPDYFSETGQLWGNPQYDWDALIKTDFQWWLNRLSVVFENFDLVRIDHFRGLEAVWMIDADSEDAISGCWKKVPGIELLDRINKAKQKIPVVAEDLGIITDDVVQLRKKFNIPGMSVLQFAFDGSGDNPHRLENVKEDCVYYTGTHDNDTARGWYESLPKEVKHQVLHTLKLDNSTSVNNVVDAMINMIYSSNASLSIVPMQDLLCLDTESRMNIPGTIDKNWRWRFNWNDVPNNFVTLNKQAIEKHNRMFKEPVVV